MANKGVLTWVLTALATTVNRRSQSGACRATPQGDPRARPDNRAGRPSIHAGGLQARFAIRPRDRRPVRSPFRREDAKKHARRLGQLLLRVARQRSLRRILERLHPLAQNLAWTNWDRFPASSYPVSRRAESGALILARPRRALRPLAWRSRPASPGPRTEPPGRRCRARMFDSSQFLSLATLDAAPKRASMASGHRSS